MALDGVRTNGDKRARTDMQRQEGMAYAARLKFVNQFRGEVKSGGRRGDGA